MYVSQYFQERVKKLQRKLIELLLLLKNNFRSACYHNTGQLERSISPNKLSYKFC